MGAGRGLGLWELEEIGRFMFQVRGILGVLVVIEDLVEAVCVSIMVLCHWQCGLTRVVSGYCGYLCGIACKYKFLHLCRSGNILVLWFCSDSAEVKFGFQDLV